MSKYPKGRKALEQENDLLDKLYDITEEYKDSLPNGSVGRKIAEEWLGSFSQLPKLNRELIKASDSDYKKLIEEEVDSSKDFIKFVRKSKMGESWAEYFQSEIDIAQELLKG